MADPSYPPPPPANYGAPQTKQGPPPQYGAPGQQQQYGQPQGHSAATTVIIQQPGFSQPLGSNPAMITCPGCSNSVTTVTKKACGCHVWMWAGIICLIGLLFSGITWLGCCLIPFCIPACYNTEHSCPSCGRPLGTFSHNC